MKKYFLTTISALIVTLSSLFIIGNVATVSAQTPPPTNPGQVSCSGLEFVGGKCDPGNQGQVDTLVQKVVNVLSVVGGIVATIMIMVGGFKYITSAGDSNKVSSAKDTILYSIIGLVVVIFAQVIVRLVINKV